MPMSNFFLVLTVYFEGVDGFDVSWSSLTEHRKHVEKVVKRHVALPVLGEHLTDPPLERVLLSNQSGVLII